MYRVALLLLLAATSSSLQTFIRDMNSYAGLLTDDLSYTSLGTLTSGDQITTNITFHAHDAAVNPTTYALYFTDNSLNAGAATADYNVFKSIPASLIDNGVYTVTSPSYKFFIPLA